MPATNRIYCSEFPFSAETAANYRVNGFQLIPVT